MLPLGQRCYAYALQTIHKCPMGFGLNFISLYTHVQNDKCDKYK